MADVFISYSTKDTEDANHLLSLLESHYIPCWMAPRDIPKGSNYADVIPTAIRQAKYFVILVSQHSQTSEQVKNELNLAVNAGKVILPVRLDDGPLVNAFEYHLGAKQWTTAKGRLSEAARELIDLIYAEARKKDPEEEADEKANKMLREANDLYLRIIALIGIVALFVVVSCIVYVMFHDVSLDLYWKIDSVVILGVVVLVFMVAAPLFGGKKVLLRMILEAIRDAFRGEKKS